MILVNRETRVLVQGITGREGQFHTKQMLSYGTKIVAGVTPGKGGMEVLGVPVYDTVKEAVAHHEVDASIIFVPAPAAADAALLLNALGMNITPVTTEPGRASAMKLCRSIVMKGMEAIVIDCAAAARKWGVEREVFDSLRGG